MICLEELPVLRYAPYIYRTKDFETWEIGFYNPILMPSREDLTPKPGVIVPPERLEVNFKNLNTNNSDIDLLFRKPEKHHHRADTDHPEIVFLNEVNMRIHIAQYRRFIDPRVIDADPVAHVFELRGSI